MDTALFITKTFLDTSKIDSFNGTQLKRWHERVFSTLDLLAYAHSLTQEKPKPGEKCEALLKVLGACQQDVYTYHSDC